MFIVKADNPDVGYAISKGTVTDSEGHVITDPDVLAQVQTEFVSDHPEVVAVIPNDPADVAAGGFVRFGDPGDANLTVNVKLADGTLLGTGGAQFKITVGDPAAVDAVGVTFDGLIES